MSAGLVVVMAVFAVISSRDLERRNASRINVQPVSSPAGSPPAHEAEKKLSADDWAAIKKLHDQQRHAAVPVDGGYRARNYAQQFSTRFDGRGFTVNPRGSSWNWGLELQSYGFPGRERRPQGQAQVRAEKERVTYTWNEQIDEWFVNDRRGLEHGFTLKQRPDRDANETAPLALRLSVRGELQARVQAGGQTVSFVDQRGAAELNYSGLKVWDADGKEVAAHFSAEGEGLRLTVEESAARYPLTIDPVVQDAYFKASNTEAEDNFGYSVAVSGETVVIGAPGEDGDATPNSGYDDSNNNASSAGAAYVYARDLLDGTWRQQAYLKASNAGVNDSFGFVVSISGNTIVVGAPFESSNATGVNGPQNNNDSSASGAAYVFVRNESGWVQQAYLKASNTEAGDFFGFAVSVSSDSIVVGAPFEDSSATAGGGSQNNNDAGDSGAAYAFVRSDGVWSQQAYLKASNTGAGDYFGFSAAISGNTIVVGAYLEDSNATTIGGDQLNNNAPDAGAAYVFARSGEMWGPPTYLKASNAGTEDAFGISVAISGETIVVAATGEDSNGTGPSDNSFSRSGAVYVFVRNGGVWSQQAYLKASNAGTEDAFGISVAIADDTIVVGAMWEDSNANTVDGPQNNNDSENSGAAYLFTRSEGMWSQQAYLKASNNNAGDEFGRGVGISGDLVFVGANHEDSNETDPYGDQLNNDAPSAGAAYLFTLGEPPTFADVMNEITVQAGSPATTFTVATVNDAESGPGGVTVTVDDGASASHHGITITLLGVDNMTGAVTVSIVAACDARTNFDPFILKATDNKGNTTATPLFMTVTPNTPPTLTYPATASVVIGNSTTVSPTAMPTDNGTITSINIINVVPPLNVAPTVDAMSGAVTVNNAYPTGNHVITVRATDNCGATRTVSITLNVICSLTLPTSVPAGMVATPYSASVAASINVPLSYSVIGGSLPPGLTLNPATGAISGTPNAVGTYNFTVKAQQAGCSAAQAYTIVISCPTITVAPATLSNGTVGSAYSVSFSATPAGSYTYNVSAGALPPGLSLNVTTGLLSGTPTAANTYTFTITAKRAGTGNCTGSTVYTLTINPAACPPSITLPALPNGKVGQFYNGSVSASPAGSYSYSVSGTLPPGVSLISSFGLLIGSPTTPGTYEFTITATRNGGGGCTGMRSYAVMINP